MCLEMNEEISVTTSPFMILLIIIIFGLEKYVLVELYIRRRKRYILRPGSTICMLSFLLFSIMLDITFSLSMSMLVLFCP